MNRELERELVEIIFDVCDVRDHTPDELCRQAPLIGRDSPFGLDSLDSLEIVMSVRKKYGVRIGGEPHTPLSERPHDSGTGT